MKRQHSAEDTVCKHGAEDTASQHGAEDTVSKHGNREERCSPRMLAMTVVTSKLQASAAIMTPPGRPSTRKLDSTCGDTPLQMAAHTDALFTSTAGPFACAPSLHVIYVA